MAESELKNAAALCYRKTSTTKIVEQDVDFGLTLTISSNGAMRDTNDKTWVLCRVSRSLAIGWQSLERSLHARPVLNFCPPDRRMNRRAGRVLHDSGKVMQGPGSRFRVRATSRPG
jgi:hypothetical protein